jgi:hypothetical protein
MNTLVGLFKKTSYTYGVCINRLFGQFEPAKMEMFFFFLRHASRWSVNGDLWWLTSLSAIFQLYRGGLFYWWRKPEDPYKTTDLSQPKWMITINQEGRI